MIKIVINKAFLKCYYKYLFESKHYFMIIAFLIIGIIAELNVSAQKYLYSKIHYQGNQRFYKALERENKGSSN